MVTHSSILAWRIPWTEEPSGFPGHGVARVGHNLATKPSYSFIFVFLRNHVIKKITSSRNARIAQ